MAELCAARNDAPEACTWLTLAIEKGYNNWPYIRSSRTYDNIRDSLCFKKIVSRI
jgi:hypothetical protein